MVKSKQKDIFDSELIASELIADILYQAANEPDVETISTSEIMSMLGQKLVDKRKNKLYDLRPIRNNIAKYTDKIVEDCLSK